MFNRAKFNRYKFGKYNTSSIALLETQLISKGIITSKLRAMVSSGAQFDGNFNIIANPIYVYILSNIINPTRPLFVDNCITKLLIVDNCITKLSIIDDGKTMVVIV